MPRVSRLQWYYKPAPREIGLNPGVADAVRQISERRPMYGTRRMAAAQIAQETDSDKPQAGTMDIPQDGLHPAAFPDVPEKHTIMQRSIRASQKIFMYYQKDQLRRDMTNNPHV